MEFLTAQSGEPRLAGASDFWWGASEAEVVRWAGRGNAGATWMLAERLADRGLPAEAIAVQVADALAGGQRYPRALLTTDRSRE